MARQRSSRQHSLDSHWREPTVTAGYGLGSASGLG
jgi:hypothetical protein